jgi:hypothetical protein
VTEFKAIKSVLHEIANEINRPHLHKHIEETDAEFDQRTAVVADPRDTEIAEMRAAIAAMQSEKQAAANPVVTPAPDTSTVEALSNAVDTEVNANA